LNHPRYCLGLGDSGMVVCVGACDGATVGWDLYQTSTRARKMSTRTVESAIPFLPWPLRSFMDASQVLVAYKCKPPAEPEPLN